MKKLTIMFKPKEDFHVSTLFKELSKFSEQVRVHLDQELKIVGHADESQINSIIDLMEQYGTITKSKYED